MAKLTELIAGWFRPRASDENEFYDDESVQANDTPTSSVEQNTINQMPVADNRQPVMAAAQPPQPAYQPPLHVTPVQAAPQPPFPQQPAPFPPMQEPQKVEVPIPYWLEDEDTLRDEGVLFGLSESDPNEKTDIIHKYFSNLAASHIADIEQHNERIQELNLFIGQKQNRIDELQERLKNPGARSEGEHHLPRTLIGITLCAAMCVGNFFLIRESLKPAFADNSWIALGVFLAGMFSLFGRISLFHDTESKVTWKSLLEEIGLPFAAALFVFANVITYQTWWQAFALFVFVFFLFLFAGKLLLSNITVLRNDLQVWLNIRRDRHDFVENNYNWESECQTMQEEMDELRVKKWQVLREQSHAETERDRLFAKRDMLIKLFESEFYLARRMKNELTTRQLNLIQKGK
ncbi:hypothetical protein [Dyadobacter fermentans]|uniref:Uncharacterized protein n=1 Tax=Dyadobacter fermentans (strain ATCC 700827 / DSM 18053 / CIP 107007 / KCTC 52180 / NS114) TaxID=471854 RepID=C6W7I0_DYAFD|nr:hypothetical protein [Dyadobacter fermentans]ACT94458.1 hypothetical protein Dfer_3246 [Dyadobacter fermentans DSM 18053]